VFPETDEDPGPLRKIAPGTYARFRRWRTERRIEVKNESGGPKCELHLAAELLPERPYHVGAEALPAVSHLISPGASGPPTR
jgi:hypothetical protein